MKSQRFGHVIVECRVINHHPRMTWIENFLSQNFSTFFWKPLFSTIHATLFIISRNFFFKIGKNENFDYKINENCPIDITKIGKK